MVKATKTCPKCLEVEAMNRDLLVLLGELRAALADLREAEGAAAQATLADFVSLAAIAADRYPLAARLGEDRLKARGLDIARELLARGENLSDLGILAKIEAELVAGLS
jgi:hypothetical protein